MDQLPSQVQPVPVDPPAVQAPRRRVRGLQLAFHVGDRVVGMDAQGRKGVRVERLVAVVNINRCTFAFRI